MTSYSDKDLFDFLNFNDTLVNSLLKSVYDSFLNEGGTIADTMASIKTQSTFFDPGYLYPIASKFMPVDSTLLYNNFSMLTASGTFIKPPCISNIYIFNISMGPTYRLDFNNNNNFITNPSYCISLLQDSSLIKLAKPLTTLSDWASVVPDTFLELCTSNINDFFYQIMGGITDRTIDGINSQCNVNDVNTACQYQTKNIRCACNSSYTNHNADVRNISKVVINSNVVNTDPWCIYPDCASGMAYKSKVLQRRSVCSNISIAGIFANLGDYSDININNTQVTASSHNDNGLNFYGPCTPTCGDGYVCRPNPTSKRLECMPKSSTKSFTKSSTKSFGVKKGNSGKSSTVKIIFLCIVGVLLVSLFIYIKTKKHKHMYQLVLLFIFLLIVLVVIIVLLITDKKESYLSTDSQCYSDDNQCTDNNKSCIFNHCSCNIGYMSDPATGLCIISNKIVSNLPYLPRNIFSGIYYYITVVNNEMYALAVDSQFKFDGEKWVELQPLPFQLGFHPYQPYSYLDYNGLNLNSNLTSVYNNKIYMFNMGTCIMILKNKTQSMLYSYDTTSDTWTSLLIEFVWDNKTQIYIAAVILGNLYVFINGSMQIFNIDDGKNIKTYTNNLVLSSYSQIITTPDNRIFISFCGISITGTVNTFHCIEILLNDVIMSLNSFGSSLAMNLPADVMNGGWVSFLVKSKYMMFVYTLTDTVIMKYIDITNPGPDLLPVDSSKYKFNNNFFQSPVNMMKPVLPFDYFGSCVSVCNMNDNIFCVNGIGDIFMIAPNFSGSISASVIPCYGVAKYDKPRKNVSFVG